MRLRSALRLAPLALVVACASPPAAPPGPPAHWSYEGDDGPTHWASLDPAYATCGSGRAQSPVDVPSRAPIGNAKPPIVHWAPMRVVVKNTGHVIQVDADGTASTLDFEGKTYTLKNLHFHTPAEHTIEGRRYDAEIHLVHESADGKKLVVAIIVDRGQPNDMLAALVDHIPSRMRIEPYDVGVGMDIASLLPQKPVWLRYKGSFTAPPCTEGVTWLVVPPDAMSPLKMSDAQIGRIKSATRGPNARPTQPMNGRWVQELEP